MNIEKLMDKASNVKKNKVTKESTEQSIESATETTSHETNLPGSNLNVSHMSAKSVVKIATLSRASALEENQTVPTTLETGKNSAPLPTFSFGVVF